MQHSFLLTPDLQHQSTRQNNDKGKVSKLNLDGCVLVGIFSGKITKWNDKKITDLNAGATLPTGNIVVVHRRYGSSSTSGTTHYLQEVGKACVGGKWPDTMNGGKNVGSTVGTDGKWFADDSDGTDVAAQGSSGVLAKLRYEKEIDKRISTRAYLFVVNYEPNYGC